MTKKYMAWDSFKVVRGTADKISENNTAQNLKHKFQKLNEVIIDS